MQNLCPGTRVGPHELVRQLRGSEGRQVFSAIDVSDRRQTVLKVATLRRPDDVDRLKREFAILRAAAGPGVTGALGYAIEPKHGVAWLALAAEGPSLAAVLASQPQQRLAAQAALAAVHAAASALGDLHARGWRHGDVKPGNLLCRADGSVVLSDLEFASRLSAHVDESSHVDDSLRDSNSRLGETRPRAAGGSANKLAGTPPFMAPELWRQGASAASPRADIWALGVTLYLCLFGDYPFGREGDRAIAEAIDRGPPPRLNELAEPLHKLLTTLLVREPSERLTDGRAAAKRITSTASQLGIDLAAASAAFGRIVTALPDEAPPADPGTVIVPMPAPELTSTRRPAEYSPGIGAAEPAPRRVGASEPTRRRTPDVGAAPGGTQRNWLEFLDISSKAAPPPPRPVAAPSSLEPSTNVGVAPIPPATAAPAGPAPSPALAPVTATAPSQLTRRAAARWYRRMNPARNFPLSVVFSGKQIRIVGGSGLGITLGQQEIVLDGADPVLRVEPSFPGCLVSPARADVVVSEETTLCRFWVTPLVCGDLSEACVTIRYRGKVVETLSTPAKVVTRTAAKMLAALGVAAPLLGKVMDVAGWNPQGLVRRTLPYAGDLLASLGPIRAGLCLAGILLAAAVGYFYVTRPLLSEEAEPKLLPQQA